MWKIFLRRIARQWLGPAAQRQPRPGKPIGRTATLSLDWLEDRLLLNYSVPTPQFSPNFPSPGILQGLGSATAGTETGSYTNWLSRARTPATATCWT